jgi:hypothetical protein
MAGIFGGSSFGFAAVVPGVVVNRLPVRLKQGTRVQASDVENLSPAMRAGKRSACLGGVVPEWAQGRPSSEAWSNPSARLSRPVDGSSMPGAAG